MKKRGFLLISVFLLLNTYSLLEGQPLKLNSSYTSICYAGNKTTRVYIPPPKVYFDKKGSKGLATVKINYTGFSATAKRAMDMAVSILQSVLPSDTRLTINTFWTKLEDNDVLGQSVITGFTLGSDINAFKPDAYYPLSLAEKIAGKDLNESTEGDIELTINSSIKWYLGIDGKTPATQYDLVTVALHEFFHGLGIYDSMETNDTVGSYGFRGTPMIYETFIEDLSGKRLIDTLKFANPSPQLDAAITGGKLYFDGPLIRTNGGRVKLYSPVTFDPGSSVSHLDEDTTLQKNALMTPFIDRGEAIHDPGKLTMSLLGDLGWINTRITHKKPPDTEEDINNITLSITISSDTTYKRNRVGLVYTYNSFSSANTIFLTPPPSGDTYQITIPIPSYETSLRYYFFAEDVFSRLFRVPSLADRNPYRIYIGIDTAHPVIQHTPVDYYLEKVRKIPFTAVVTDNIGIDTVYVEYRINEGPMVHLGMSSVNRDSSYVSELDVIQGTLAGGDNIQYRIVAVDVSSQRNIKTWPSTGFKTIRIEDIGTPVTNYFTNFSNASNDFFNLGFNITQPANFNSPGLHSEHPYKSTLTTENFNFISLLRIPVIFDPNGMKISFREVVLVEPGEAGSVYGSPDFYDYVIMEASRDYGKNWFALTNGYDSRYKPEWDSIYKSNLDADGNSKAMGRETMMREHLIYPTESENFKKGDTLLFRFRLFSDPFANGWGWAIDDLKINQVVDKVDDSDIENIKVYPNPGNGKIRIITKGLQPYKALNFKVFNSAGASVLEKYIRGDSESEIDITGLPSGYYFIRFEKDSGISTFKYSLIK